MRRVHLVLGFFLSLLIARALQCQDRFSRIRDPFLLCAGKSADSAVP